MKIKNFFKNKKGFSLVEIIIYLSIFTFVSIFTVRALIISMSSFSAIHTNNILLEGGLSSMDRISREVRQATSIDIGNSSLGSNPGVLQLNSTDSSGSPIIIKISKAGDNLNVYKPTPTLVGNLLNGSIVVDSLIFRRIDTVAGEAVKIEMTLRDIKNRNNRTEKFYNTVILRGSY